MKNEWKPILFLVIYAVVGGIVVIAQPPPPPEPTTVRVRALKLASQMIELSDLLLTDADLHWLHEELKRDGVTIDYTWNRDSDGAPFLSMSVRDHREGGE